MNSSFKPREQPAQVGVGGMEGSRREGFRKLKNKTKTRTVGKLRAELAIGT